MQTYPAFGLKKVDIMGTNFILWEEILCCGNQFHFIWMYFISLELFNIILLQEIFILFERISVYFILFQQILQLYLL
jgi:hypothetical protein